MRNNSLLLRRHYKRDRHFVPRNPNEHPNKNLVKDYLQDFS